MPLGHVQPTVAPHPNRSEFIGSQRGFSERLYRFFGMGRPHDGQVQAALRSTKRCSWTPAYLGNNEVCFSLINGQKMLHWARKLLP